MTSSIEEITYSFVKFFYHNLNERPSNLFKLYTADAHLTHSQIPDAHGVNFISKNIQTNSYTTKSSIEGFYAGSKLAESKIRVSSIDFQPAFGDSIFISVLGELALKDEIAVYRFTQSFILKPAGTDTYDIANDIFRLIPDEEYELNTGELDAEAVSQTANQGLTETREKEEDATVVAAEMITTESETIPGQIIEEAPLNEEQEIVSSTEKESSDIAIDNPKDESNNDIEPAIHDTSEAKESPVEAEQTELDPKRDYINAAEDNKTTDTEAEKPTPPAVPRSWVQAASSSAVKPPLAKMKAPRAPEAKLDTPLSPPQNHVLTDVTNSQKQGKKKSSSGSDFPYAVVVNNVNHLDADQIKRGFEKEFGRVLRAEPKGHWALVAFELQEGMKKALEKKKLTISNSTVTIEIKSANRNFSEKKKPGINGNGSKTSKDKPQQRPSGSQKKKVKQSSL